MPHPPAGAGKHRAARAIDSAGERNDVIPRALCKGECIGNGSLPGDLPHDAAQAGIPDIRLTCWPARPCQMLTVLSAPCAMAAISIFNFGLPDKSAYNTQV